MILYAYNNMDKDPVIITEETGFNNDGKIFKKIPEINLYKKKPKYTTEEI